jgi:hypothetical protein
MILGGRKPKFISFIEDLSGFLKVNIGQVQFPNPRAVAACLGEACRLYPSLPQIREP